jgi:uncharacterized membrane protein YgdD (TMEM256/DUF423 family)
MTAARIHILLAALMGAAGVTLWAMGAHRGGPAAVTAAQMLLIHAGAVAGITACRKQGLIHDRLASLAVSALVLGVVLFSADLATRAFGGSGIFPMTAPAGGLILIGGWLLAAVAALIG